MDAGSPPTPYPGRLTKITIKSSEVSSEPQFTRGDYAAEQKEIHAGWTLNETYFIDESEDDLVSDESEDDWYFK